ncbi:unnamed protein product [Mycena citricolor]|uniref:RRM domain-containing protein n=1 Tax=Mycena citricolor TaxID=2018698 RepID=A0AAD2H279_9AGAR|nr:unnamed protein product [Mycena citricolor]
MSVSKRLHVSFTPSVPQSGPEDLKKSLTSQFSRFATVKSVDGVGQEDALGAPRKFAYVSVEGSEASITKCVNALSGSIWKGVRVRVGDARPDFHQRIAQENTDEGEPKSRGRKRKHGAKHAEDMSLVTAENAKSRPGWKVTEMGRAVRPIRMRPSHPLPPPLATTTAKTTAGKPKKKRDPASRARRRTIDPTRWDSVHLKGMFLENASLAPRRDPPLVAELPAETVETESDSDPDSEDEVEAIMTVKSPTIATPEESSRETSIPALTQPLVPPLKPVQTVNRVALDAETPDGDLQAEKSKTLDFLNNLFAGRDRDWDGRESVGSDVDEEELLKIGGVMDNADNDGIEYVPMDVDTSRAVEPAPIAEEPVEEEEAPRAVPRKVAQTTKLKDLFVTRDDDIGFSLLGQLELDLELDDELAHILPSTPQAPSTAQPIPAAQIAAVSLPSRTRAQITLDPKQPLFFPLPTSFQSGLGSTKARQRDILDVGKDNGWNVHFVRNETDDEIRKKWEEQKGDLTREWNRRWREAGKVKRRRGAGLDAD